MTPDDATVPVGVRLKRTAIALGIAIATAWLAFPLIGLLSTWLRLPPNFRPLATLLLGVMILMAGVVGWFYDPNADPQSRQ